jgi:hypothetical protein
MVVVVRWIVIARKVLFQDPVLVGQYTLPQHEFVY